MVKSFKMRYNDRNEVNYKFLECIFDDKSMDTIRKYEPFGVYISYIELNNRGWKERKLRRFILDIIIPGGSDIVGYNQFSSINDTIEISGNTLYDKVYNEFSLLEPKLIKIEKDYRYIIDDKYYYTIDDYMNSKYFKDKCREENRGL